MTTFFVDEFITTQPGQAYRLLPYGPIVKGGKRRNITKELASKFKLPHFKPPIKLGSHADATPAGGQIIALEVREDGLWAVTELTPKGAQVFNDGDYRYHSPEIIWEDGALEHPETGEVIDGPFIVGDALLHTPHLGEATAFYTYQPSHSQEGQNNTQDGGTHMTADTVQVPNSLWEKIITRLFDNETTQPEPAVQAPTPTPEPTPTPSVDVAQFNAVQTERDDYAAKVAEYEAKIEKLETERKHAARVEYFTTQFKNTALADAGELHGLLANIDEETAEKLTVHFRALAAQAADVTREVGGDSNDDIQGQDFNQLVTAYSVEHKTDYVTAFNAVSKERPELLAQWQKAQGGK